MSQEDIIYQPITWEAFRLFQQGKLKDLDAVRDFIHHKKPVSEGLAIRHFLDLVRGEV